MQILKRRSGAIYLTEMGAFIARRISFGLFQSPNNHTIITSAPRHRSGGASGMLGTARLLGQSTGAAMVALMFNLAGQNATHVALITAGTLATLAAIISGLRVTQPKAQA